MKIIRRLRTREYLPFTLILCVNVAFLALAFAVDSPRGIFAGFLRIIQSRSILVTDYIAIGGMGAALLNVSVVGISTVFMLLRLGQKPTGANVMAVFLSIGFAFFGKNVFNMIPLTFGVWLFSKYVKSPFSDFYLSALLVATVSPTISEIAFLGMFSRFAEMFFGILLGFLVGFIFPAISAESVRLHSGFNLYNMGVAGGIVATILAVVLKSMGIDVIPADFWSSGNNFFLACLLYSIAAVMLIAGLFSGTGGGGIGARMKNSLSAYGKIHSHHGRLVTDFYLMYGGSIFINMAALCIFATTLVLVLGADLSGPVVAGILTMTGFGSLGKHLGNVVPIVAGAVLSAFVNTWDPSAGLNIVPILFSSGLAPLAGMFGWGWGVIAGFLHVNVANYIGDLNGGLNLYNNGFAAVFVVMFLLPVISIFHKEAATAEITPRGFPRGLIEKIRKARRKRRSGR